MTRALHVAFPPPARSLALREEFIEEGVAVPRRPVAFRVALSDMGLGTVPVVFTGAGDHRSGDQHLLVDLMAFRSGPRPDSAAAGDRGSRCGAVGMTVRRRMCR